MVGIIAEVESRVTNLFLGLQKANNFQNWENAGRSVGERVRMMCGAGVFGYLILESD